MAFTQRSEETRNAILAAARRRFADDGYERATIRAIAADAGIDPSMVMRYYGSKEGLFAAAVDISLRLPTLEDLPPERCGEILTRHFLALWEDGGDTSEVLTVLLRSAISNEASRERVRTIFATQVRALIGPAEDADSRAALLATQILGLALCRYVLRLPEVVALDEDALVASVGPTVQRYVAEPIRPGGR